MLKSSKKRFSIVLFFLIIFVSFTIFSSVAIPKAQAQWLVTDQANLWQNIWATMKNVYEKLLKKTIATAFKEGIKIYLSQVAYQTATWLAQGGRGQKPQFFTKPFDMMKDSIADVALGTFMDELTKGFGRFNICEPSSLQTKLTLHFSLFEERKPLTAGKPKCTFSEMKKNWDKWQQEMQKSPERYIGEMKVAFKGEETDMGAWLTLESTLLTKEEEAKANALLERSQSGIKAVTSKITNTIKSPTEMLLPSLTKPTEEGGKAELTYTGELVDAFLGTFTNTFMAKWTETLMKKGFNVAEEASSIAGLGPLMPGVVYSIRSAVDQQFASLAEIDFAPGDEKVIDLLGLPSTNPLPGSPPGPTSEVITDRLATAIKSKMTLQQAIDKGNIDGSWVVGFNDDKQTQPDYDKGYPYRSLVILRTHRIVPVGWELAALYYKEYGERADPLNFNYLIHCFEDPQEPDNPRRPLDCREDTNANGQKGIRENTEDYKFEDLNEEEGEIEDFNPYYHLVDPNWVLKSPETKCQRQGPGPEIVYDELQCMEDNVAGTTRVGGGGLMDSAYCESEPEGANNPDIPIRMVQRNDDYCGDWQSCVLERDDGSCQAYGYCVEEKPIWRFEGSSCDSYYNSCEVFNVKGTEYPYLRNTLKTCANGQGDAGCQWYSIASLATTTGQLAWSATERVYLNKQAQSCTYQFAGCTKLASLKPGVNLAFNGDFHSGTANLPDGWETFFAGAERCVYIYNSQAEEMEIEATADPGGSSHCMIQSSGFMPIDTRFTYQISYKLKAEDGVRSAVGLLFYDANKQLCDDDHPVPCRVSNGDEMFAGVFEDDAIDAQYQTYNYQIGPEAVNPEPVGSKNFPQGTKYVKLTVKGPHGYGGAGSLWADDFKLFVIKSPVVKDNKDEINPGPGYSQGATYAVYLKVPPAHLDCRAYNTFLYDANHDTEAECLARQRVWRTDIGGGACVAGGSAYCSNYTNICSAEEVGCQGYTPLAGGPQVPAKTVPADVCPAECAGYDSYLQMTNYFEEIEDPAVEPVYQHFIAGHQATQQCSAQDRGCEQFTNLAEVKRGGEGIEYFTYLRQCISATNPNISTYYTWEGSDTSGFQLKKWTLLKSDVEENDGYGPCTNITIGTEDCIDGEVGQHDCEYPSDNLDCRDFFDAQGKHYSRLQKYTITASGECYPYRRTATGQIYNADPMEGIPCAPSSNKCREYKGNIGNNTRQVINLTFKDGTVGAFTNSSNDIRGLNPSNEAVVQGDLSLRVTVSNDKLIYRLENQLQLGKLYQLYFWAKRAPLAPNENKVVMGGETPVNPFTFTQRGLTDQWQLYTLGPQELVSGFADMGTVYFVIAIENLGGTHGFYIDNIILEEFTDNFYVIEDSWQTPGACDLPYLGAQLGCRVYSDTKEDIHYLKSFDYICSASSIGCEAFINTQNSTGSVAEQIYSAICSDYVGEIKDEACSNPAIPGNGKCCSIRGVEKCSLVADAESCEYENYTVPNDELVYLVNDPDKGCGQEQKGCTMMGLPELNRLNDYYDGRNYEAYLADYVNGYTTTYIINDPNHFCDEGGLYCQTFTGDPELTSGPAYYYNPLAMSGIKPADEGEVGSGGLNQTAQFSQETKFGRTCYYSKNEGIWKQAGTGEPCSTDQFMPIVGQEDYEDWVGICEPQQSTCTEYRDPEQPTFAKAEECDALISPQLRGVCNGEGEGEEYVEANGKLYCQKVINGVPHKVCKLKMLVNDLPVDCNDSNECIPCPYTENDWICTNDSKRCLSGSNQGTSCTTNQDCPDSTCEYGGAYCNITPAGKQVCYLPTGQASCQYSLACEPYYYLKNSVKTCSDGIIDREAGCILFNDTSVPSVDLSSDLTADGQVPQAQEKCSYLFSDDNDCDANTQSGLKVRKDRECAETLYCTTATEITNKDGMKSNVCLALGRCKQLNPNNPSSCLDIVTTTVEQEQTYNFLDQNGQPGVDLIRNLSGFSRAGLVWDSNTSKQIFGYLPPDQMSEIGQKIIVANAGFENHQNDMGELKDWTEYEDYQNQGHECIINLDNNNPHSGSYSAKLHLRAVDNVDFPQPQGTPEVDDPEFCLISSGYYPISPEKNYVFSFYARSTNGAQRMLPRLIFSGPGVSSWSVSLNIMPPIEWTYYSIVYGPDGYNIPDGMNQVTVWMPGPYHSNVNLGPNRATGSVGSIWLDDIQIKPALKITEDGQMAVKECRLYPSADAPACEYTDLETYKGWYGYCLERDYYNPEACLQWYPIDSVAGESLSALGQQTFGYTGRLPLYYCLQSSGNKTVGQFEDSSAGLWWSNDCEDWRGIQERDRDGEQETIETNDALANGLYIDSTAGYFIASCSGGSTYYWNIPSEHREYRLNRNDILMIRLEKVNELGGEFPDWLELRPEDDFGPAPVGALAGDEQGWTRWYVNCEDDNDDPPSCESDRDWLRFAVYFNEFDELQRYWINMMDTYGDNEAAAYKIIFYVREGCRYIAQVVKDPDPLGEIKEKAWYTRYTDGWQVATGNTMGYNPSMEFNPYGSSIISDDPSTLQAQLDIYLGRPTGGINENIPVNLSGGTPISIPSGHLVAERKCLGGPETGKVCLSSYINENSADDCYNREAGLGGICMGVGRYCYNANTGGMTNGTACNDADDCSGQRAYTFCQFPNLEVNNINSAIGRLNSLFAEIWDVWKWDRGEYKLCLLDDEDEREDRIDCGISDASVADDGSQPTIDYIKLNGSDNEDVVLTAPGGLVNLSFTTDVTDDQLPLETIAIDWQDGSDDEFTGPMTDRPAEGTPHRIIHVYSCKTNAEGDRCVACRQPDGSWVDVEDGTCEFNGPEITIKDHWEFEGTKQHGKDIIIRPAH